LDLVGDQENDTNVLVAAFLNISVALAPEYEEVLKREGILPGVSETEIDDFLDYPFKTSYLVPFVLRRRPTLLDPDDEGLRRGESGGVAVVTPAEFSTLHVFKARFC
jgi:hypothetical protein